MMAIMSPGNRSRTLLKLGDGAHAIVTRISTPFAEEHENKESKKQQIHWPQGPRPSTPLLSAVGCCEGLCADFTRLKTSP